MGSKWGGSPPRILGALVALSLISTTAFAGPVGICYGTDADNLPTPTQAVSLLQSLAITHARIFDSNAQVIQAFADSGIDLGITIDNNDLPGIALSQNTSDAWIAANVLPYVPATNISSISVGSEVIFANSGNTSEYLVPAMENIYNSLKASNLNLNIQVVTTNAMTVLSVSYPPSAGVFDPAIAQSLIFPLLNFLAQTRNPFLLNSYPYYAYMDDPTGIALAYALFAPNNGVTDSNDQLQYTNLLDAQLDAVYSAMKALNFTDIQIVIAETGWPSKGDANETAASLQNAQTYNQGLINHIDAGGGTPLQPGVTFESYIFSLYNEDLKQGATSEQNFGIYYATETPVYTLNWAGGAVGSQPVNATWCIAATSATNASLLGGINYACSARNIDCSPIQLGGDCYVPNTYVNHADWAFNEFYQSSNLDPRACNFSGTATLTTRNPSYGNCVFFSRTGSARMLWQQLRAHPQTQIILTLVVSFILVMKLRD